jgi:hypothetical protein
MNARKLRSSFRRAARGFLACALLALAAPAPAEDEIAIFDAHLHYNWEPQPFYSLEQVLEIFRRNNVTGILATSRPNTGTHALVEAKRAGVWVVPFIRPYRTRADIGTWHNDPAIYELVEAEYKRGYYRGVGEFHVYGKDAGNEVARKIVRFAAERGLYLHAHCDDTALEILFSHDRRAKIVWAHTGFSTSPARVTELLERYPSLWGELSYRSGITENGKLSAEWRALFAKHSDRFLLGSDTWINERWFGYDNIMREYRGWLAQLPRDQAQRIAAGNAERLFGPRKSD